MCLYFIGTQRIPPGLEGDFISMLTRLRRKSFLMIKKNKQKEDKSTKIQSKLPKCVSTSLHPQMLHVRHVASSK